MGHGDVNNGNFLQDLVALFNRVKVIFILIVDDLRHKGVEEALLCPTFSFHVDAKLGQIGIVAYHKNQQPKCISINESLLLTAPISAVEYHLFGV